MKKGKGKTKEKRKRMNGIGKPMQCLVTSTKGMKLLFVHYLVQVHSFIGEKGRRERELKE
jgi:hypothetical protein